MGKIIALANQKGGVGKTTTSINLAAGLSYCDKKVLLVDFDPQSNATQGLGITDNKVGSYEMLLKGMSAKDCTVHLSHPQMDIIPTTINLSGADLEMGENFPNGEREKLLKNKLSAVKNQYDYIIIDCPPSLGLLNTNALTAADSVIIPIQCEYYALVGLSQLLITIQLVKKMYNRRLDIEGVVLTMFDTRTKLSSEVQEEVRKYFKDRVYQSCIPRNVRLSEAPSKGKSIFEYDVRSEGAKAYASMAKELIARNTPKGDK